MINQLKFDFGTGESGEGYSKLRADAWYDAALGYGFVRQEHSRIAAKDRGEPEALRRDFCIPLDAVFRVDVPDGVYTVHALIGDAIVPTETTIKAGCGRLMVRRLRTSAGQFIRYSFSVWVTGGRLELAFSGLAPRINALEIVAAPQVRTLFLAGDSTVTDQPADGYPYAGWGQMLPYLFKHDAAIANFALSGRSSKSFIQEGHLDKIWAAIKPHDILMIQFGHNDQKPDEERHTDPFTTYKEHLLRYIEGAREREAYPILITSVQRRYFEPDGTLTDTHGDYLTAVRELAAEENVPLVDLAASSKRLFEELGPEGTKSILMWGAPGEFMNFPGGVEDNTHFQERGAVRIAELVVEGLREQQLKEMLLLLR
ncbi:Lysophospholipase L1 [Paenibacillus sp. UNCCL117]|uniref:rhamnogalacturonan acetylesterase n=1 Tax=unclassified Paenibacillus TaxID=185978 RepID=UPI0008802AFA|nr:MULTISPECIES: GDSL-type esterase/lipase family protein [unclassified Paenibacillus]SDD37405.1 Lysophospholipase L1 [Paenibacillus sp. cl123]SFW48787.1 Lysophospholipase L1 [Paenibacillus sp. UNCCL117]